jgi:hypothetical protein
MFTDSPMTPAEQRAFDLYENWVAEARMHARIVQDPKVTNVQRSAHAHRMLAADKAWQNAWKALLVEPTPEALRIESGRLTCEGLLLVSLVTGFVGLFLPDLLDSFWPLAVTFVVCAALGGWSVHFLGRLGRHLGKRL